VSDQDLGLDTGNGFASEELIAAREALGLTAEAIQRELRLTPRVVAALESGDLQGMGQPVFARGYIRSYCKRVGINADPFVEQYDTIVGEMQPKRSRIREMASSSPSTSSMNITPRRSPIGGLFMGAVKVVVLAGVLGGAVYGVSKLDINLGSFSLDSIFGGSESSVEADSNLLKIPGTASVTPESGLPVPSEPDAEPTAVAAEPSLETVIESTPELEAVSEVQTEVVTSLDRVEEAVTEAVVENSPEPQLPVESAPEPAPEVAAPAPVQAPAEEATASSESAPALADGVVRVSVGFSDVSWVNIKDSKGDALFNGLAERGRTLELTGVAPINFVFGRADAVSSFTFNGTTVDLAPHTKNNVARLSLPR